MIEIILPLLGGLGIFLLGMIVMTENLKSLTGDYMRSVIIKFTNTPASGAVTGAVATAVLQSSSATTVVAVGFVGAGLLSFTESLGIIFGANIGTTITGWLVVLVGFKFSLADFIMPVILIGVLLKLFGSKKLAITGLVLSGFALIFVGISMMQVAMSSLPDLLTPDVFPEDTLTGRLQLFFLGLVITVITQSSSAGVAIALTALFAGAVSFEQAAVLVIGMDVGTTSTTLLATLGGNVSSRRTGLSHVIYNIMTGAGALLLLSPYIFIWEQASPGTINNNPEIALVAFHTGFNAVGVLLVLPFIRKFSEFIKKIIPEKESVFTAGLDKSLLSDNGMAILALTVSVKRETQALLSHLQFLLGDKQATHFTDIDEMQQVLNTTHAFADHIHIKDEKEKHRLKLLSLIHALDHMQRLHERFDEDIERAKTVVSLSSLKELREDLNKILSRIYNGRELLVTASSLEEMDSYLTEITRLAKVLRNNTMLIIASGELTVDTGNKHLEAIRWLRRVSIHVYKIMHHLGNK